MNWLTQAQIYQISKMVSNLQLWISQGLITFVYSLLHLDCFQQLIIISLLFMFLQKIKCQLNCATHPQNKASIICLLPQCQMFLQVGCCKCKSLHSSHLKRMQSFQDFRTTLKCFCLDKQKSLSKQGVQLKQIKQKTKLLSWFRKRLQEQQKILLSQVRQVQQLQHTLLSQALQQLNHIQKQIIQQDSLKDLHLTLSRLRSIIDFGTSGTSFRLDIQKEFKQNLARSSTLKGKIRQSQRQCTQLVHKVIDVLVSTDFQFTQKESVVTFKQTCSQANITRTLNQIMDISMQTQPDCLAKQLLQNKEQIVKMQNEFSQLQQQSKYYQRKVKELKNANQKLSQTIEQKKTAKCLRRGPKTCDQKDKTQQKINAG